MFLNHAQLCRLGYAVISRGAISPRSNVAGRDRCSELELSKRLVDHVNVSKVEQMESELRKLSQAELRQIRGWLDDVIEDELEFTPEFERSIQQSERDMAENKSARMREPEGA